MQHHCQMDTINNIIFKSCLTQLVRCKKSIKAIVANRAFNKSEKTVSLKCVESTVKCINNDMSRIAVEGCNAHIGLIKNIHKTLCYLTKKCEQLNVLLKCAFCLKNFKHRQNLRNHNAKFHAEENKLR